MRRAAKAFPAQGVIEKREMMLTPEQVKQYLDNDDKVLLLDVREPAEFAQGHIEGAALVPLAYLLSFTSASDLGEEVLDPLAKEKGMGDATEASAYLVYCHSGVRAETAALHLRGLGFEPVYNAGGIVQWPYGLVTAG